jgi:hypothetical protein
MTLAYVYVPSLYLPAVTAQNQMTIPVRVARQRRESETSQTAGSNFNALNMM